MNFLLGCQDGYTQINKHMAYQSKERNFLPVIDWTCPISKMNLTLEWATENKPINSLIGRVNSIIGMLEVHRLVTDNVEYTLIQNGKILCGGVFKYNKNLSLIDQYCNNEYNNMGLLSELFYFVSQHEAQINEADPTSEQVIPPNLLTDRDHFLYNSNHRNLGPIIPPIHFGKGNK